MDEEKEMPLTPSSAARMLGITVETLTRMADDGRLKSFRLPSGHRRYPAQEILDLIAARTADKFAVPESRE